MKRASALVVMAANIATAALADDVKTLAGGVPPVVYSGPGRTGGDGGRGGDGGDIQFYKFYFPSVGGSGSSARSGDGEGTSTSKISKCSLKIGKKSIIKATGCQVEASASKLRFSVPSDRGGYVVSIIVNEDKTGQGYLRGGGTSSLRDLGLMTRRGACWGNTDVKICAYR